MNYTLITGASSGIGREFAYHYAKQGNNLILVARRKELLEQVKNDIISQYQIEVQLFDLDITQTGNIDRVIRWIKGNQIRITTFINNAGMCIGGEFAQQDREEIVGILNLNINAVVSFCREIIPLMKENGGGQILNVASIAAFEPCPDYALYFASKAFVLSFTESLHMECKPYNIVVSALCPGFVKTDMIKDLPDLSMKVAEPADVVTLGEKLLRNNRTVGVNGLGNNALVLLTKIIPRSLLRRIMEAGMDYKKKRIRSQSR